MSSHQIEGNKFQRAIIMLVSIVSATVAKEGNPREFDRLRLRQRFDKYLCPRSGEIGHYFDV